VIPGALPPHRVGFRFAGVTVGVASPDPALLAWLEEFLRPAFELTDAASSDRWVVLDTDDARLALARARGPLPGAPPVPGFIRDGGPVSLPEWGGGGPDEQVLFDPDYQAFYRIHGPTGRVTVLAGVRPNLTRVAVMRVVRELALAATRAEEGVLLHAAAVAVEGRGVVLAGPERAGKTTLLLHLLQVPGAAFAANDRVLVHATGGGAAMLRPVPTIVTIRAETLGTFPAIAARIRASGWWHARTLAECDEPGARRPALTPDGAATLSPAQLCRVTGTSAIADTRLWRVIFPRVTAGATGIRLQRLSAEEAAGRLRAALFGGPAGARRRTAFGAADRDGAVAEAERHRQTAELARRVPCHEARLGAAAFGGPAAAMALVTALAGEPTAAWHDDAPAGSVGEATSPAPPGPAGP
jgi:hypothetical protein